MKISHIEAKKILPRIFLSHYTLISSIIHSFSSELVHGNMFVRLILADKHTILTRPARLPNHIDSVGQHASLEADGRVLAMLAI